MTAALANPSFRTDSNAPIRPSAFARTRRAADALRRNRLSILHRHGYAPDQEHGARELGAIYDLDDPTVLEDTLFVTTLTASNGAALITIGRWQQGFLDIAQLVAPEGTTPQNLDGLAAFVAGARRTLSIGRHDVGMLKRAMGSQWNLDLRRCELMPVAGDRCQLLDMEQRTLGLVREDVVTPREVDEVFRAASGGDPMGVRRLLDAGRMDLLTGHALYLERVVHQAE